MRKVARASNPGRCAWARCQAPGELIFEHLGWRILACSMKHALVAHKELEKIPEPLHEILFKKQVPTATKLEAVKKFKKDVDF